MGFLVYKLALRQVFSENFISFAHHSTDCSTLIIILHLGLAQ
jgi:hypothetical protein